MTHMASLPAEKPHPLPAQRTSTEAMKYSTIYYYLRERERLPLPLLHIDTHITQHDHLGRYRVQEQFSGESRIRVLGYF